MSYTKARLIMKQKGEKRVALQLSDHKIEIQSTQDAKTRRKLYVNISINSCCLNEKPSIPEALAYQHSKVKSSFSTQKSEGILTYLDFKSWYLFKRYFYKQLTNKLYCSIRPE